MRKVKYTAVVLTPESRELLLTLFPPLEGYEPIAHHMTICMGEWDKPEMIGRKVLLTVVGFDCDSKVSAVEIGAGGGFSKNGTPHVTISVNRGNGGKPVMSNDLKNWTKIHPFLIEGIIEEVC
jgi:hypothetical protein